MKIKIINFQLVELGEKIRKVYEWFDEIGSLKGFDYCFGNYDLANIIWDSWARRMPSVMEAFLHDFPPICRANWMETMVGMSYAWVAGDRIFPQGCTLRMECQPHVRLEAEFRLYAVWHVLQTEMRLRPALR